MRGVRAHSAITQRRGGGVASFRESVWRDAAILAAGLSRLHERGTADLPAPTAWLVAAHSRDCPRKRSGAPPDHGRGESTRSTPYRPACPRCPRLVRPIGRASVRERLGQSVYIPGVAP